MSTATAAVNHWPDNKCAKAFWSQRDVAAYHWLLADTANRLDPKPNERWIDLGCGCGELTRTLWEKSRGSVAEIVALDVAAANANIIARLRDKMEPPANFDQVHFLCADFSQGLAGFGDNSFDGAMSGLAIQYAEHWDEEKQCWSVAAYDHLLADVCRVLRPGGRFVFSVNVPEPSWWTVALTGVFSFFRTRKPLLYVKNSWRMMRYGRWLKKEARRGRFHYLYWGELEQKLRAAGFVNASHKVSFAGQAYVVRCEKPA